jgi:hypothetical protein
MGAARRTVKVSDLNGNRGACCGQGRSCFITGATGAASKNDLLQTVVGDVAHKGGCNVTAATKD